MCLKAKAILVQPHVQSIWVCSQVMLLPSLHMYPNYELE